MTKKIALISGYTDLSEEEFAKNYVSPILYGIMRNYDFVLSDDDGTDLLAQKFLNQYVKNGELSADKITIYHLGKTPRYNVGGFKTIGGYHSTDDRDVDMLENSNYDIIWVKIGREMSRQDKNIKKRKQKVFKKY